MMQKLPPNNWPSAVLRLQPEVKKRTKQVVAALGALASRENPFIMHSALFPKASNLALSSPLL